MRRIIALTIFLTLFGCSQTDGVESAIKKNLKDPESARFDRILVSEDGIRACAIWNAKNGFGGYGYAEISELNKINDRWIISDRKINDGECNESFYELRDKTRKLAIKLINDSRVPDEMKNDIQRVINSKNEYLEMYKNLYDAMKLYSVNL